MALAEAMGAQTTLAADYDATLAAVTTGDPITLVLLPTETASGPCYHELAAAIRTACIGVGRTVPRIVRVEIDELDGAAAASGGSAPDLAGVEEPPAAPVLDERTLSTLAEDIGDRGFVLDTIEVFLAELPERVAGIARGITAGLPGDVKAVSHSLKSSAAMLGALRLSQLCADLEHQAAAGINPADPDATVGLLRTEATEAEAALRAYLAS